MGEQARRLLKVLLAGQGTCSATETGMTQVELHRALADLDRMVDDDNHRVDLVHATKTGEMIARLELTAMGRGLAAHA
jgi:hypothetical protein